MDNEYRWDGQKLILVGEWSDYLADTAPDEITIDIDDPHYERRLSVLLGWDPHYGRGVYEVLEVFVAGEPITELIADGVMHQIARACDNALGEQGGDREDKWQTHAEVIG